MSLINEGRRICRGVDKVSTWDKQVGVVIKTTKVQRVLDQVANTAIWDGKIAFITPARSTRKPKAIGEPDNIMARQDFSPKDSKTIKLAKVNIMIRFGILKLELSSNVALV